MIYTTAMDTTKYAIPQKKSLSLQLHSRFKEYFGQHSYEFIEFLKELFNEGQYEWGNKDSITFYSEVEQELENHYIPNGLEPEYIHIVLEITNEVAMEIQRIIDGMGYRPYTIALKYFNIMPILKTKWVYEFHPMVMVELTY